jgi:hypothetical protein
MKGTKMKSTKSIAVSILLALSIALTGCSAPKAKVPDLSGSDLTSAKAVLTNLGLVPTVQEIYSDTVDADLVVKTKPAFGTEVDPNAKVTIIISKGPKTVYASDSQLSWTYVSYGEDDWNFSNPYIEDGKLHVDFTSVKLMANVKWKDDQDNGYGFGLASITDTFDKSIPLQLNWNRQYSSYGEEQSFEIVVPVTDLEVQKPTNLYMKLYAYVDGSDDEVSVDLSITW